MEETNDLKLTHSFLVIDDYDCRRAAYLLRSLKTKITVGMLRYV